MVENNLSVDQSLLNSLNVEQSVSENYNNLVKLGGQVQLCALLGVDVTKGLSKQQVLSMR